MPQCSHMILPSARWNESAVRLPFDAEQARGALLYRLDRGTELGVVGGHLLETCWLAR